MNKIEQDLEFFERKNDIPKQEKVSLGEYALDPRRYANAIVERPDGLPETILKLDEVSLRQMMNYIEKSECEWTGKNTYLDKVVSFLNSGAYDREYLERVFGKKYITKNKKVKSGSSAKTGAFDEVEEEQEIRYYVKDRVEYAKIEVMALQNWQVKGLGIIFEEYFSLKYGKLTKELIESTILAGIKDSENEAMRLRWVKEGMDILGLKKGSNNLTQVNVYSDGGGQGLGKRMTEISGNDNFNILGDD